MLDLVVMGDAQIDIALGPVSGLKLDGQIRTRIGGQPRTIPQVELLAGRLAGRRMILAQRLDRCPGGSADNLAFASGRLGTRSSIICSLGDDEDGMAILNALKQVGVDTTGVKINGDIPTGVSVLVRTESGQRSSIFFPGANARLSPDDLPDDILEKTRAFCFCFMNFFMLTGIGGNALAEILGRAKDKGAMTFLDPGPIPFSTTDGEIRSILRALASVDYFLPTEDEAQIISGRSDSESSAEFFLEQGVASVIVKLGEQGCLIAQKGKAPVNVKGIKIGTMVDTTGAGDVFAAAFISRLLRGEGLIPAAEFANAAAAIACTGRGRETFPTSEETLEILKR